MDEAQDKATKHGWHHPQCSGHTYETYQYSVLHELQVGQPSAFALGSDPLPDTKPVLRKHSWSTAQCTVCLICHHTTCMTDAYMRALILFQGSRSNSASPTPANLIGTSWQGTGRCLQSHLWSKRNSGQIIILRDLLYRKLSLGLYEEPHHHHQTAIVTR